MEQYLENRSMPSQRIHSLAQYRERDRLQRMRTLLGQTWRLSEHDYVALRIAEGRIEGNEPLSQSQRAIVDNIFSRYD